jgi:hypothetical protein
MKMKKFVCILILICVIMGAAFAQAKPATPAPAPTPAPAKPATPAPAPAAASSGKVNAIGVDLFQLVKGFIAQEDEFSVFIIVAGYERLVSPHFTIGAALDMYFITSGSGNTKVESKYFNAAAEGRYYPSSENFDKFFVGTTLGFSQLSVDGSTKPEKGGFSGLSTSLKMGYKVITAKGLYLEPSLAYVLQKTSLGGLGLLPLGWNGGLRLGWVF